MSQALGFPLAGPVEKVDGGSNEVLGILEAEGEVPGVVVPGGGVAPTPEEGLHSMPGQGQDAEAQEGDPHGRVRRQQPVHYQEKRHTQEGQGRGCEATHDQGT